MSYARSFSSVGLDILKYSDGLLHLLSLFIIYLFIVVVVKLLLLLLLSFSELIFKKCSIVKAVEFLASLSFSLLNMLGKQTLNNKHY